MSKISVKVIQNEIDKIECMGEIKDNKIVYKNDLEHITIDVEDKIKIIKIMDESKIEMDFDINNLTKCIYSTKYLGSIDLNIKTNLLEVDDNRIYIEYTITESNEQHTYEIEYEVI